MRPEILVETRLECIDGISQRGIVIRTAGVVRLSVIGMIAAALRMGSKPGMSHVKHE